MIYLDNAATTFPKPPSVIEETVKCMTEYCGNPGRGSHRMSIAASDAVYRTREKIDGMFDGDGPDNCVFTLNTTYALNIALRSVITNRSHILISDLEHNSVYRQMVKLRREGIGDFDIFRTFGGDGDKILTEIKSKIKKNTRIIMCLISSNICGIVLPVEKIGKLCRERGILFIADAAQSAGIHEISIKRMNIDALCIPSHKGLYGPQGAGAIVYSSRAVKHLHSVIDGGSGSNSLSDSMPDVLPDKLEAGTVSTPAVAALGRGIEFVERCGINELRRRESELGRALKNELLCDSRITVYDSKSESGIVLFNIKGKSSNEVSDFLDSRGICVRAGFHCSPLAHKALGTGDSGAVRVSFGAFNEMRDVKLLLDSIIKLK